MTRPTTLTASAAPVELTLSVADTATVDERARTITGVLVPAGDVIGATSVGRTRFSGPSSVTWHEQLRRVKLLREHQHSDSLGYATELTWSSGALVGTFYVPPGPEGDRALADAENGIRDGLSVGVHSLVGSYDRDGVLVVTASTLREVSLVSVPAFDDSRVAAVASTGKEPGMFTAVQLAALRAAGIDPNDQQAATSYLNSLTASATPATPADQGGAPVQLTASDVADELMDRLSAGVVTLDGPNAAPGGALNAGAAATGLSLSAFTELVSAHQLGDTGASTELRAALSDIVPGDHPGAFRPAYLDELWEGAGYVRRFIDAATVVRPLPKAMQIIGQRWETPPQVDDYAGDKGPIPSNEPKLVDIPVAVKRLAGGHDVDRAFVDLGSPAWLASYFEAQTEDVKKKSDARAAQLVYAGGTALVETEGDGDTNPATFTSVMEATVEAVVSMAATGESVDYVAMAPGLIREFLNVKRMDGMAYMGGTFQLGGGGDGTLGGVKFLTSVGLTGRQVVVGSKSASRWHEFATPIRVQAVNVANGGIDLGVFQYYAGYVRNPLAVRTTTISAAG